MQNLSFKNKKRLYLILAATIILFAVVSAIFCMRLSTQFVQESEVYYTSSDIFADDDFSGIRVAKSSLNKKSYTDFMAENNVDEIYSSDKNITLTAENAEDELEKLGYTVCDKGDDYLIYTQFFLKRLMVSGDYSSTFDAVKVVKGTNYDTLCYESEQATANAYYNLLQENGVSVMGDALISVTDDTTTATYTYSHDYSGYKSWGAEAMDIEAYNEYLATANCDKQVAVVVIDTGINTSHEMFKDRLIYEDGKIVGESICGTTYKYSGYSFEDDDGHGTHVSGIIAGLTPQNVKIIPIKVINANGGTVDYFYTALEDVISVYSKKYNIVAVNMSLSLDLGGLAQMQFNEYYNNFLSYFDSLRQENILPVVAAGNSQKNVNGSLSNRNGELPSKCDNAVVVSSIKKTTKNGKTTYSFDSSYSNYGDSIDFSAPGTAIVSAYKSETDGAATNVYAEESGTSMATPHVVAAIALLCIDINYWTDDQPEYTADTIEQTLRNYTIKIGGNTHDKYYGYGMVNFASFDEITEITVTLQPQSSVYGDEITLDGAAYTISSDSIVDTSGLELVLSTDATYLSSVGKYDITATIKKCSFHYIITIVDSTYTITPREIAISLNSQTGYYGDIPLLDQTQYTVTQGSFLSGDEKDLLIYTYADGRTCGSFPLYYAINNANYTAKSEEDITAEGESALYTVQPREIEIELEEQFGYYGDQILLDQTLFSLKSGSIVNSDSDKFVISTTATAGDDIGEYKLTFSCVDESYIVVYNDCNYTILPKDLTVKICDQQIVYSDDIDTSSFGYEIVDGDDLQISGITIYTGIYEYNCDQTYTIYGENSNSNYNITFINGKLSFIDPSSQVEDDKLNEENGGDNLPNDGEIVDNNGNNDNESSGNVGENGNETSDNVDENDGEIADNSTGGIDNNVPDGDGQDTNNVNNDNENAQNDAENLHKTPEFLQENSEFLQENGQNDAQNNYPENDENSQNEVQGEVGDNSQNIGQGLIFGGNNNGGFDANNNSQSGEQKDSSDGENDKNDSYDSDSKQTESSNGSSKKRNLFSGTGCASTTTGGGDFMIIGLALIFMIAVILIRKKHKKAK